MVVIGGMVGGGSLGYIVVSGFSQDQLFGKGLAAGVAIAALGVMLDRIARVRRGEVRPVTSRSGGTQTSSATAAEKKKGRTPMARRLRRTRLVALAAVVGLGLTACGGSDIKDDDTAQETAAARTAATSGSPSTRGPATSPTPTSSAWSPRRSSAATSPTRR